MGRCEREGREEERVKEGETVKKEAGEKSKRKNYERGGERERGQHVARF